MPPPRRTTADILAERPDVVRDGTRLVLTGPPLTREEATIADLRLVRDALDAAGIDYLLIRGDRDTAVLSVDRARRARVEQAFATAFAGEPMYARVLGSGRRSERLLARGRLPGDDEDLFLIYRPRTRAVRGVWRAADAAIRLEFWRFDDTEIVAPRPNALTRQRIRREDAVVSSVERYGDRWPTLAGMFDEQVDDIDFDIDLVFSWVDGSEPGYLALRESYLDDRSARAPDGGAARYRQIDELRYAMRSARAYAPWIRRIHLVTDSTPPAWLDVDHPDVRVVRSADFFEKTEVLPTFNSHAIEAQLHRIPGLSEHFLYSNDDMFFGRPVAPSLFFSPGGVSRFVEATLRIGLGAAHPDRTGHDNAMRVNRALLQQRFGRTMTRHLEHCAAPLRRSVLAELEAEFPEDFARTAASRFRSGDDISVTNSLYHYYALLTGRAVVQTDAHVRYVETTLATTADSLRDIERRRRYDMFCLNDGSAPEISDAQRVALVTAFLERYFPVPGPWERTN
ncbi:stealth conserved region 3 domain-containing protein [Pseudolysinimonas kribbensis]|uniref:Exopolysaccharide phosphotransferase CpsY n=1 Tax=Pseudolysinimonas kribbensis TaxID=433641 RepID=A0ABQ6K3B7_9MICO|nr:stealth family protein [Pseudolysinimonas kribbensis]GMA93580.1 exopolysaccharide phosphotransferase CpsY [Pseudolysinimonas kribbensis]